MTEKLYQDGQGPSYTYTDAGRLKTRTWAREVGGNDLVTTFDYNEAGQLDSTDYSDSTPDITLTFDRRGRKKTSVQSGQLTTSYAYSDAGRLLSESYTSGLLSGYGVTNTFNGLNQRTNLITGDSTSQLHQIGYAWDDAGRMKKVTVGTNTATYSYLANGPLIDDIEFHNGSTLRMTTTKTWDSLNRLTSISSVTSLSDETSFAYLYNDANQRTKATREDGSYWLYGYDDLGQVTSGKKYFADDQIVPGMQFEYGYDDIGNRDFARSGGDENGRNLREERYSANLLNQYSRKTVPGFINVMGSA